MFTGIIEQLGVIKNIKKDNNNLLLDISVSFVSELKINQSISHNGICLTVIDIEKDYYRVCVINETIKKTNIQSVVEGDLINLERCLVVGDRIDGHIVQGHVDGVTECVNISEKGGSWYFTFKCPQGYTKYLSEKGSICINGVSLTVANIHETEDEFSVAIIPYTFKHTNFKTIKKSDFANVEFDILAKQIDRLVNKY
ncbi:MAG: riboflavin synthase [Flavobacteriales bacterium]|nr:riboflavin synthase [Flavobacteriales bacterium]|tara:strand:- start:994 stop:1587 length:594 start_codon:yes stop_codon:yes gene_type:complete